MKDMAIKCDDLQEKIQSMGYEENTFSINLDEEENQLILIDATQDAKKE
jgi:hypothetical protein